MGAVRSVGTRTFVRRGNGVWVDTAWDGVQTIIRPAVGGYLMTTATDTQLSVPALDVSGVLLALSSHSAKASIRLVVNTSPEPVSNVAVSVRPAPVKFGSSGAG